MQEPLVSVITVTLNRVKFLEETILSVKGQDYSNLEHIIIDGGSTDGTIELLKSYENQYNMRWISEKDEGIADGLNKGFEVSKGDIFCWLDSDDTYLPKTVSKVIDVFKKHEDVDLVFGNVLIVNDKGKKTNYIKFTDFDFETWIYEGGGMNPAASFWRKKLYWRIGGINEKYMWSPDIYFFTEAGALGSKFYHINDFLSAYRLHSSQILANQNYFMEKNNIFRIKKRDYKEIKEKYIDKNLTKTGTKLRKVKVLLKRTLKYIRQGDSYYILRGVLKRLKFLKYET